MSYTHLTTTERVKIETYLEIGMSIRSIARRIGRQPSTVSREIRRNPDYVAERAQKRYEKAKTNCGAKTKLDDTMLRTIVEKLRVTWSPEQIVGRLYAGKMAFSTIYLWIYAGRIDVPLTVLRQNGKRQKPTETRGRINIGLPLETAARGQGSPDVRRAEEPVLSRPADRGPHRGLDGGGGSMRCTAPSRTARSRRRRRTVARSSAVTSASRRHSACRCISPTLTHRGNGGARKCLNWKTAHEVFTEEVLRLI